MKKLLISLLLLLFLIMLVDINNKTIKLARQVMKQAYLTTLICPARAYKKDYYKSIKNLAIMCCNTHRTCQDTIDRVIVFLEARAGNNFVSYLENGREQELIAKVLAN